MPRPSYVFFFQLDAAVVDYHGICTVSKSKKEKKKKSIEIEKST